MLSVEEARAYLLDRARPVEETERIAVEDALGRIVAADVAAPIDVPGHANSAMDGYAVRAADIPADGETTLRVAQRIAAGEVGSALAPGEAARIFTGAPIPEGADAIAIQEDCRSEGATVTVPGPLAPGTFIRPRGNDIRCGSVVLAAGARIRPQEMGVVSSVGIGRIDVRRRPRVAIVSSGDELRRPGEPLGPGQIYNSNRFTLLGLLQRLGCDVLDLGLVADTFEATRDALLDGAARADVLITTGGVSVGEEDHVRQALEAIGELEMWKVRVKPGKPIVYGRIGTCDLLGLPGNPVSALVTFCLFVRPFILRRLGAERVFPPPVRVGARFEWPRPGGRREYARARLVEAGARRDHRRDPRKAGLGRSVRDLLGDGARRDRGRNDRRPRRSGPLLVVRGPARLMATVRIQEEPFDAGALIAETHRANPKVGAVATFIGLVRDVNEGADVAEMTLEHYPGMTERAIENICRDAAGALGGARRARRPPGGAAAAHRPYRHRGGGERAPRGRVRGLRVHHGLPQDPRAVVEEGAHRRRRALGGGPRERRRGGGALGVTTPAARSAARAVASAIGQGAHSPSFPRRRESMRP